MKIKSIFFPAVYLLTSVCAFAQAGASSEVRQLADFNSISASFAVKVVLEPTAGKPSVKVVAEGIDLDKVLTEVSGDELKVSLQNLSKSKSCNCKATVFVSYTSLKRIEASLATTVSGTAIKSPALEISASDASKIVLTGVETDVLTLSASNAAKLDITGKSEKTTIEADNASKVEVKNLLSASATVSASNASKVELAAEKELTVKATNVAHVRYKGNPAKIISQASNDSSVKKL